MIKKTVIKMASVVLIAAAIFSGCGKNAKEQTEITKDSIAAKVNDVEITLEEASFYAYMEQANYEAYYVASGVEIDWSYETTDDDGNTVTIEDLVKEESMEIIYRQILFEDLAEEYGITLDEEDLEGVATDVSDFFTDSDDELLEKIGASKELVEKVYKSVALYKKVCEKILSDNPISVSYDDAKQAYCIVAVIDSEITSQEATAKKIVERMEGGETITYQADVYGLETSEGNIGKGDMDNALEDLCLSLSTGEFGYCEVDGYYYVVYCTNDYDEEATEYVYEDMVSEAEAAVITSMYEELLKDATIKEYADVLATITFSESIFTLEDVTEDTEE